MKGLIRLLKGLIRPFKGLIRLFKGLRGVENDEWVGFFSGRDLGGEGGRNYDFFSILIFSCILREKEKIKWGFDTFGWGGKPPYSFLGLPGRGLRAYGTIRLLRAFWERLRSI